MTNPDCPNCETNEHVVDHPSAGRECLECGMHFGGQGRVVFGPTPGAYAQYANQHTSTHE